MHVYQPVTRQERTFVTGALVLLIAAWPTPASAQARTRLEGRVVDATSGALLPCRLYVEDARGAFHLVRVEDPGKFSAVAYDRRRGTSVEKHTTLSAHPFVADLVPGRYKLAAERGKEYVPAATEVQVGTEAVRVTLQLRRWVDMAARGWYSGDTHVHRQPKDLPNLLHAEDLNVAFPLVYWVTQAFEAPQSSRDVQEKPGEEAHWVEVDATHGFWPRNTEYEIFRVAQADHTLGAFFLLGHKSILRGGVPPVGPVVDAARREGALVELDKHAWPWSMALVPAHKVDLYELANNHLWRAPFHFSDWGEPPPPYMGIEKGTERGWIDYGLKNYYALLNCGLRPSPTAGTASGVHPVPLGFGRVYVQLDGPLRYEAWLAGLKAGRSFVTTGPMLLVRFNGEHPGHVFRQRGEGDFELRITGKVLSAAKLESVEFVVNGEMVKSLKPEAAPTTGGPQELSIDAGVRVTGSSWVAVRAFETTGEGRPRFAHTGPVHVEVPGRPLKPRREEVEFLAARVAAEIERSKAVLPAAAIAEYERALQFYRALAQ